MNLIADYHTHSKFSRFGHGKDTIEQMVFYANEIGLKELAITDHGYNHFFRTSREKMAYARKLIDDYNTWSKTKILLGIEADIINERGDLDIDDDTLDLIDILVVGYHKCIKTDFASFWGKQKNTKSAITKATNAFINCMERYPVTFISHINSCLKLDLYKIGCVCKDKDVYIELNNSHPNWTSSQMEELLASGCSFVVNSDAHSAGKIGSVDNIFELIKKYKIPASKFVNVEFDQSEMSRDEQEFEVYYDIYKQRLDNEKSKMKYEIDNSPSKLSKEMEDELEKIAGEQGITDYHRRDGYIDPDKILKDESYQEEVNEVLDFMDKEEKQKEEAQEELQNPQEQNEENSDSQNETKEVESNSSEILEDEKLENSESENQANEDLKPKEDLKEEKANDFENENLQENQVEQIKIENEEENKNVENGSGEDFDKSFESFFDSTENPNRFNVNKKSSGNNASYGTTVIVKNNNGNAEKQEPMSEKTEKTSLVEQKPTKTNAQNGLIDFSSLKDDDK